jgi:replicative DNA helicase
VNTLTPPADLHAERAVLGSLLMDRDAIVAVAGSLEAADFYHPQHGFIYAAVLDCFGRHEPPDLVTVAAALRARGQLDAIGDVSALTGFSNDVPTSLHVEYYATKVEEASKRRRGIQAASAIAAAFYDLSRDIEAVAGDATKLLTDALTSRTQTAAVPAGTAVNELIDEWRDGVMPGVLTQLADLDRLLIGLQRGDLIVLAARPEVGKTSLACQMAKNIAADGGAVLFFSLEMPRKKIIQRLVCQETGFDMQRMVAHRWHQDELPALLDAAGVIAALPMWIEDRGGRTIGALRTQVLAHIARHGRPALVMVDYLQRVGGDGKYNGNRVSEVGDVSKRMKALAMEIDTPILALAQVSRGIEHRNNHTPTLSDLRESGDIEADADVVLFIHREELYDAETDKKGIAELHIGKNRQGPHGVAAVFFDKRSQRWMNLDPYTTPQGY